MSDQAKTANESFSKPIAIVDGIPISYKQFTIHYADFVQAHKEENQTEDVTHSERDEIKCEVVNKLIDRQLLIAYGKRKNYLPNIEEVTKRFNNLTQEFKNRKEFEKTLGSLDLNEQELMQEITNQLIIDHVIQKEINTKLQFDDKELHEFYDYNQQHLTAITFEVFHIFMRLEDEYTEDENRRVNEQMKHILHLIDEGVPFEELAKRFSQCPSSDRGGSLGYFTIEEIDHLFENQIKRIEPGYISQIVETQYGFHVVMIGHEKEPSEQNFEEIKDSLRENLYEMLYEAEMENLLTHLRDYMEIEIFDF